MAFVSRRGAAAAVLFATATAVSACSTGERTATPPPSDAPPCPVSPIEVVVSVDQWGEVVSELGGACANVTTLLAGSSADPHDYEPSPADAVKFEDAQLVVVNGGHYDEWAVKLAASSAPDAPVIDAVEVSTGHDEPAGHDEHGHDEHGHDGHEHDEHEHEGNPHVWYQPTAVTGVADAVTARLSELAPGAAGYFADRRTEFADALTPYQDLVAKLTASAAGKTYAATETVFDPMAAALGLRDETPPGYQRAASNESEPSPADLDAFLALLRAKGVDVLIYNTQTQGSVPEQLRATAEAAGVPVVEVTETVAPDADSFEAWQVDQLTSLAKALGVTG